MPRKEGFDEEAMERKIKRNMEEKGFTVPQIQLALLEELKENIQQSQVHEARAAELSDQIDYINEKYMSKPA